MSNERLKPLSRRALCACGAAVNGLNCEPVCFKRQSELARAIPAVDEA
jgi:hypothetical protein